MPVLSYPYVFTNGTIADANQVNANFNAVSAVVNGIDNANVGPAGFYASQIIPTTAAQAIFGGSTLYTFPAGLTVVGGLTMGGNLLVAGTAQVTGLITSNGGINITGSNTLTVGTGTATFNGTVSAGTLVAATATITALTVSGTLSVNSLTLPGTLSVGVGVPGVAGDGAFGRTASTGAIFLGGSASVGRLDYGISYATAFTLNAALNVMGTGLLQVWNPTATGTGRLTLGLSPSATIDFGVTLANWIAVNNATTFSQVVTATRAGGTGPGYLAPAYSNTGAPTGGGIHTTFVSVTATGTSTTVTLAASAAFSSGTSYLVLIYNATAGTIVTAGATTGTSVQFASVSGQTYILFLYGI